MMWLKIYIDDFWLYGHIRLNVGVSPGDCAEYLSRDRDIIKDPSLTFVETIGEPKVKM